ncbi:MAG TPA: NAD(P)/FAD-dependent oxidoreductase [Verrucomicrobiae bacterium]|jgi:flavin-dependent dehydrogenase
MNQIETDVLIIGAGPAGAMAASILNRENFRVLVVEKQQFPRFVIGESMLPVSMNLLANAGLLETVHQQGFMRKNGAVFLRGDEICNFDFSSQFTDGWDFTYQVPRADFDQALADAVAARGVEILYRHGVTAVRFEATHAYATIEKSDGSRFEVKAKFIFDASGYGRVLPRLMNLETPSKFPQRAAQFTHITGDLRPTGSEEGKIWVCLHPGGAWIWIIPFANGKTSVGVVAGTEFFENYPGDLDTQLRAVLMSDPNAARRLAKMEFAMPAQRISGYACSVKQLFGERFVLVGNATEFLDPVFSSGVALALASSERAAQILVRQLRGETVDWQGEYADYVRQGINTFRAYVNAWYDGKLPAIFFAANRNPDIMRQICSVLAGYVWDKSNPYVVQAERALSLLAQILNR